MVAILSLECHIMNLPPQLPSVLKEPRLIEYCGAFAPCKNGWATETAVTKYYTHATIERGYETRF
jgi:hypothetical protein